MALRGQPQKEIKIKCPFCHHPFKAQHSNTLDCAMCGTIIHVNADGDVQDYEAPEHYGTLVTIFSIASIVLLLILVVDASLSDYSIAKFKTIGVIIGFGLCIFFLLPFRMGFSIRFGQLFTLFFLTLILLIVSILHIGNFIDY
jgi:hypothetical protein